MHNQRVCVSVKSNPVIVSSPEDLGGAQHPGMRGVMPFEHHGTSLDQHQYDKVAFNDRPDDLARTLATMKLGGHGRLPCRELFGSERTWSRSRTAEWPKDCHVAGLTKWRVLRELALSIDPTSAPEIHSGDQVVNVLIRD